MDAAAFEQVYGSFRDFHAYFAPLFGRRETREHSGGWYSLGSGATLRYGSGVSPRDAAVSHRFLGR